MERRTERLQDLEIDTFTLEEALEYANKTRGQVVTLNPEMVMNSRDNASLKNIIQNAELVIPDGVGIEIGLKILGKNARRIAGIEFAHACIAMFHEQKLPIALIGAAQEVNELACSELKKKFAGLNIAYAHNGFFKDETVIFDELKKSGAQLVLVALGSPKQEEFIYKLKKDMPNTLFIGVGGSFDVWSNKVERAPEFYQKAGLEWLYRTVKEPARFRRIFPTLPLFVLRVVKERICKC
ncbi:MAG: WecB/TagA/CpsF family glycosyltransferase [Fusobacterium sp.]|nr:WecB/TagA/CpsF family glycosyltransferase [Fusobacterium sp.]